MAFTYRQTKGSPLTAAEVDANFYEVESLHDETEGYKDDAAGSAGSAATSETNAAGHATDAETAKDLAQAAANFKGYWADLTGAASMPYSAHHDSAFWALTEDLADVTAKEPGVDSEWVKISSEGTFQPAYNHIGVAGGIGFGVGIIPPVWLPDNVNLMPGTETLGSDNYGNYQRADGSIECCIVAFWLKIGNGVNGFAVNHFSVLPFSSFTSESQANDAGYMLPRAFKDGGKTYAAFFYDKYKASKIAWGTGYIAGSVKDGLPLSSHADHNPFAELTNCSANAYYEAINAAKAIGGVDGAAAADPQWHCASRFQTVTLAILATAHGQAATSTTYCAWYDSGGATNYPKGCNDNALGDTDDTAVHWESDGYSNCGKTGSAGYGGGAGNVFAKSTHNGQNCGVADVNGLMHEINIGVTCVASTVNITAVTNANPCQITAVGHGRTTGDPIMILSVGGTTEINDKIFTLTRVDDDNFTLDGVDSTAFGVYTSGGTATVGDFYVADEATAMKDFTSGNTLATDHWGATGVAAMMTAVSPAFVTGYSANGFVQRMGSGANQVLSESLTGNANLLTNLGIPKDAAGADTTGTNLFGKDYFYQYIRNELCVRSAGHWSNTSDAGVWASNWTHSRTYSNFHVGFRCACYPEKAAIAA
jgi:hypothetical protein